MFESDFADWSDIQLTYSIALVHAMNGRISRATNAICTLEAKLPPQLPDSIAQRWLLWKADILMLAGLKVEAQETAKRAVSGYRLKWKSYGFAGAFARWAAITCLGTELEDAARDVLRQLEQELEEFDALDQLEILCANAYFGSSRTDRALERIAAKAKQLPFSTLLLLERLGMTACAQSRDRPRLP